MGDTSETKTKVLSRELFLGVVALKTPIPQNHYLRDKVPFLKSGHIYLFLLISAKEKNGHKQVKKKAFKINAKFEDVGLNGNKKWSLNFHDKPKSQNPTYCFFFFLNQSFCLFLVYTSSHYHKRKQLELSVY